MPEKVPQPHGGALLHGGMPGNAGGGRPRDEFKALCRELASGEMTVQSLQTILADPKHAQFVAALRYLTEQGYGKPVESVEVSGKDGGPIETRQQIIIGGVAIVF
jgi:hypothetical protein